MLLFDADAFEKVVYNLVSNAIKFTPEGAGVEVGLEAMPASSTNDDLGYVDVKLTVKDQGRGMTSEEMALIFDRFYQVESSHSTIPLGVGLGLALTKELVELHGGDISVKSRLQQGSTFTVNVTLPADTRAIEVSPVHHRELSR